ncbi:MAG TPA: anti-sigma factor [Acidimicrobiales bacterium]|nr:anti-sigma factor [Acidimicrobiales bacterium]
MNEHDEIAELLGAYALDAVDADEAATVEAHLAVCPRCAAEVADHREVAAMLAHSGAPAPEGLWTRISASLEEAPPEMDLRLTRPGPAPDDVVDLAERRQRRSVPRWLPGAAVAAALVVVALVAGLVIGGGDAERDPDVQIALTDVARDVMNDPDATRVVLRSPDGGELEAPAAIDRDGAGYLMGNTLPALDDSETYQLWGIQGDLVVSLGVLGPSPEVVAFRADPALDALAITQEVAPGVVSSENPALLVGEVS